jgi:hypothetical protein
VRCTDAVPLLLTICGPRVSEAAGFPGADGIGADVAGADFCCADVGCADVACAVIEAPRAVRPLLLGARAVRNDSGGQVPRASNSRKPGPAGMIFDQDFAR